MDISLNDVVVLKHTPDEQPWIVEGMRLDGTKVDIKNQNSNERMNDVPVNDLELAYQ